MKKSVLWWACVWLIVACGGPGKAGSQDTAETPQDAVDRVAEGESPRQASSGDACSLMKKIVPELLDVDVAAVTFRASEIMGHDLCRASAMPGKHSLSCASPN